MRAAMALARLAARWRPLSAVDGWTPWANARGMASAAGDKVVLPRDGNQARGIAEYAIGFLGGEGKPAGDVMKHTKAFYVDASLCGVSAIALQTNAPAVLRREAARYPAPDAARGATVLGSSDLVMPEKAALANGAAVREWDSNGTNFGCVEYLRAAPRHTARVRRLRCTTHRLRTELVRDSMSAHQNNTLI